MPGSIIASYIYSTAITSFSWYMTATAFAINMVASSIISKAFGAKPPNYNDQTPNPGNNQQLPPAGDNKVPVVYGSAYVGGIITDVSITDNNQKIYYVLALSEVTNTETGGTPDTFTFGNVYWGGKKCVFANESFTEIGQVTSVSGNVAYFDSISTIPKPGQVITFSNTGNPNGYIVDFVFNLMGLHYISFLTSVENVTVGSNAYIHKTISNVVGLLDESTGNLDTTVDNKLNIYLYSNGSSSGTNTTLTAIEVMNSPNLVYTWDETKLMSNCAFAIIEMTYSQSANLTGIQQTRFQITNSRYNPGDCFLDYLTSKRYGAALLPSQINTTSLDALNLYCAEIMTYTPYTGGTESQTRFRFDGVLQTDQTIMTNMQAMASCCDCLIKFNEITGQWGVIVQSPTYAIVMDINDSNMVSAIQISPIDLASSYNIAEVKFPDGSSKDSFNSATFDLAVINPDLMYPNEPVNKQTINLPLVNNSVRAQYLANRFLEGAREDLQVKVDINFSGIQLEAGDIVTVTNANYGWAAKEFRISQVVETFTDDGQIIASLTLMEFNASVYDDVNVTQFTPAPNTGIGSPLGFGILYTPTITNQQPNAPIPSFDVAVISSSAGIVQYAEVYYSAYASPTDDQRIFAGVTAINPGGNPYNPSSSMGVVVLTNIPQGDWYFAVKYFNALGSSNFSASSSVLKWRPLTFQYSDRYLSVRYADSITGTGFSSNPRNKTYYGLQNVTAATGSENPADYIWYPGDFSTANYLLYINRQNRKFSFAVGNASFNNLGGAFTPTVTSTYDPSIWGALEDGLNYIDLDLRTGQLTQVGSPAKNVADGLLSVTNNTTGTMTVALEKFLNFGNGVYSKNFSAATLTVDVFGRVVGFSEPDSFYYTETVFTSTAGQTTFSVTHTVGNVLVFRNSALLPQSDYTETSTTIVMNSACVAGETVVVINMRAVSTSIYYEILNTAIASSGSNTITYTDATPQPINAGDLLCFASAPPASTDILTTYTVQSVNTTTKVITFTTSISGATAGLGVYRKRDAGSTYAPFARYTQEVTDINTFTPTAYAILNGFESIYINGVQINEIDYDITDGSLSGFPASLTGSLDIIMFAPNNYNVPASNITNNTAYSTSGALSYPFPNNPLAMEIYANGVLLAKGSSYDYTATSSGYNLTTAFDNNFTLLNQQTFARDGAA